MKFSTEAIHAGQTPDKTTGAVTTPIFMTSTYVQDELGVNKGYHYGRTENLTRESLEKNIATLEKGESGISFSSGIAAIHSLMNLVKSGENVIVPESVYGGTFRLFQDFVSNYGVEFKWIDMSDFSLVEKSIDSNTKLIYMETPSNPLLKLTDIEGITQIARSRNILTAADNTFMTPYFQRPLELGADIVIHSTSKYLSGHSDIIGGIVVTNNDEVNSKIRFMQKALGAIPSPFDCWITLRSTKTLVVRMKQHENNANILADYLQDKHYFKSVIYPGLPNHPDHELAKKQMSGFGAVITVDFHEFEVAKRFLKNIKIFHLAESLGGVESLVNHSATMTHASVPKEIRDKMGITDGMVRISVGIEDVEDLIEDFEQAINKN